MGSLEAEHGALAARAGAAARAEEKALADRAEAQARADSAERSSAERVRSLEEEATRLRRQLETGADAAQARIECMYHNAATFFHGAWCASTRRC